MGANVALANRRNVFYFAFITLMVVALFQHCGNVDDTSRTTIGSSRAASAGFSANNDEWQPVVANFKNRCFGCHGPSGQKPIELFKADALAKNTRLVDRLNPENSVLYQRINDNSMPKNGTPFSDDEKKEVLSWLMSVSSQWVAAGTVLQNRCFSCHGPAGKKPIDMFHPEVLAANAALVDRANPQNSLIYRRIVEGTMPPNGNLLTSDETLAVLRWIVSVR